MCEEKQRGFILFFWQKVHRFVRTSDELFSIHLCVCIRDGTLCTKGGLPSPALWGSSMSAFFFSCYSLVCLPVRFFFFFFVFVCLFVSFQLYFIFLQIHSVVLLHWKIKGTKAWGKNRCQAEHLCDLLLLSSSCKSLRNAEQ